MRKYYLFLATLSFLGFFSSCGNQGNKELKNTAPELKSMKCEFVPDGGEAVLFGSNLTNAEVIFPGDLKADIVADKSNDSVLTVVVPAGSKDGRIKVKTANGVSSSKFFFRDNRNIIVNFDRRLATWGGYNPYDEKDELITGTLEMGDEMTPFPNGAKLPEACSGNYGFLYGKYSYPWVMNQCMYLQYVANPMEGGRGPVSVAGSVFDSYDVDELALKFEVYVPKEAAYKGVKTEIFFGPIDAKDKHGRDLSPICFWEPYKDSGEFYTDGWKTVTIPLNKFTHSTKNDTDTFECKMNLKKATNFSFLQFGAPEGNPQIFMCVDNFRIVPIAD